MPNFNGEGIKEQIESHFWTSYSQAKPILQPEIEMVKSTAIYLLKLVMGLRLQGQTCYVKIYKPNPQISSWMSSLASLFDRKGRNTFPAAEDDDGAF